MNGNVFFNVDRRFSGDQMIPDREGSSGFLRVRQITDSTPVRFIGVRQHLVEQDLDVRIAMPRAGYSLRNQFGIDFSSAANFSVCFGQAVVTEQEVSVSPGDLG